MTKLPDTYQSEKHNASSSRTSNNRQIGSRTSTNKSDDVERQPTVRTDGGRNLEDELTKFQTRILAILAKEPMYGLAVMEELEEYYETDVNHGQLYPNLDELVDFGLVEKGELDLRTNEYTITSDGRAYINQDVEWLETKINRGDSQ